MNGKNARYVLIFGICVLIGALYVVQSAVTDGQRLYVSAKAIDEYRVQTESEKASIENLHRQIEEAEAQLAEYERTAASRDTDAMVAMLREELDRYLIMTGMEPVHGEGVRIVVDDGTRNLLDDEDINNIIVHDADILMVINELKRCRAEAIAVNGHRVTPNTSITCSGYTVRIDGQVYARPFEITAIGDSKRMSNALLGPEGYGTSLKNWGVQFSLEVVEDLYVGGAEKIPAGKFANVVKNVTEATAGANEKQGE